ncbi:MAG: radical SAM protein [Limnohabitans sp.]|nr:radical SAM protein [Limnohabitans sp.]
MKYSQFNSILPYNDKYSLYNSFEQKVIFIDPQLKELLEAGIAEGIDNLVQIHPDFYNHLVENNFLVENEIDEVGKVKKISKEIDESQEKYELIINPTMNCNFKCWYCYETHIKKSRLEDVDSEKIKKFIHNTASKASLKHFNLSFFGGEPLLYFSKNVTPLIDYFVSICKENNKQYSIGFTTNAYLINEEFIEYFKKNKITCNLQITLDGYREEHDKVRFVSKTKGSYFEIVNNIKLLIKNQFYVTLRINYTDENLENTSKIPSDFLDIDQEIKDNYLHFNFQRVWQNKADDDLHLALDEKMDSIKLDGFMADSHMSPNSVLNSCYADKRNSVVINYNGDIFKCTARDFETKNRGGYINDEGELIWENDYNNRRMNAKFNNKPCLTCRIMPLCNGGCSQHAFEYLDTGNDYCVYNGDEKEKDKIVFTKIKELVDAASS